MWLILTSGTVLFNQNDIVPYVLIFDTFLVIAQLISVKKLLRANYCNIYIHIGLITLFVMLTVIVNSDYGSLLTYARVLLMIFLAFGTSLILENEMIAATFTKVIIILAGISIIFFYTGFVNNNISYFPVILFNNLTYVNAFIYILLEITEDRNFGIFSISMRAILHKG